MPAKDDALSFARFLFDDRQGFAELCYAPGDPQDRRTGVRRLGWYDWPREAAILAEDAEELAERYGDVYIGSTLYREEKRDARLAKPSRIIFVDDPQATGGASVLVRTSAYSQHAYYRLAVPVDAECRANLQKRAAIALQGDNCHDVTRIVRLPIGLNTKRTLQTSPVCGASGEELYKPTGYPVHLERQNALNSADSANILTQARTYTVAELEAMFPPLSESKPALRFTQSPSDDSAFQNLPDPLPLLKDGIPRRWSQNSQGRRLLDGRMPYPETADGRRDTSLVRAIIVNCAVLHGHTDEEVMALALHLTAEGSERKGAEWLWRDCDRLLAKARARWPDIEVHASRVSYSETPQYPPKPQITPDERRAELCRMLTLWRMDKADGRIWYDVADIAEGFGVCVRTIQSDLATMEEAGEIVRHQQPGPGGKWWIEIAGTFPQNLPASEAICEQSPASLPTLGSSQIQGVAMPKTDDAPRNAYGENTPPAGASAATPPGTIGDPDQRASSGNGRGAPAEHARPNVTGITQLDGVVCSQSRSSNPMPFCTDTGTAQQSLMPPPSERDAGEAEQGLGENSTSAGEAATAEKIDCADFPHPDSRLAEVRRLQGAARVPG